MTILLIEDNHADVEMIRELLSDHKGSSFDIVCADRLSAAKPFFTESGIDIILLDLGLPDSQGLDTLRRVRELAGEVPIVVLTMLDNEETGLNALKEGAQDYLVKGQMNGPLIARSLRYAIERGRIEQELKKHRDSLEELVAERTQQLSERKKMTDLIEGSLAEKETLLREIHHRVKNNLQIVVSLIGLQIGKIDDQRTIDVLKDCENRVKAMSIVHEKLYRSGNLSQIDFGEYISFLASHLISVYSTDPKMVRLDFSMGKIMVDINTAIPLGLVMNELISNALKHAFPNGEGGTISIGGGDESGLITLFVRDNGIGTPAGFDWKTSTSLGLRLVANLVRQVRGRIEKGTGTGTGTTFTITIPKKATIENVMIVPAMRIDGDAGTSGDTSLSHRSVHRTDPVGVTGLPSTDL